MKLAVVAATGGIGRWVFEQALDEGHEVVAVVRSPKNLPRPATAVAMDLMNADPSALAASLQGVDAVISGLGPRSLSEHSVTSTGTRAIVDAMKAAGARRLVVVSAAPIGTVPSPGRPNPPRTDPGDGFWMRHLLSPMIKRILRAHYADLALMEDILRESDLEWTSVRPPRLTNGKRTQHYRTAYGMNLLGGGMISRADVADLMLKCVPDPKAIRQTLGIAY